MLLTPSGEYEWGHSRCALREVHPDGRIVVFGTWQKIDAPKSEEKFCDFYFGLSSIYIKISRSEKK